MKNIIALSGSLRKQSYNTSLIKACKGLSPEGMNIESITIENLPHFNEDVETDFPEAVTLLKQKIEQSDGIIIATPEYNRSIPGVLKNAIDWLSRPYGKNSFKNKTVLIIGASVSPVGAALGQHHLKQILLHLDANVMGQPEFYLSSAHEKFDSDGVLTDELTKEYLSKALHALNEKISS
jgi:chromate reductase